MIRDQIDAAAVCLARVIFPNWITTSDGYLLPTARLVPHLLSLSRPCLACAIVSMLATKVWPWWIVMMIVLMGITDKLDGSVARWCGCDGAFGKAMDSTCDKISVVIIMIALKPLIWTPVFWSLIVVECALQIHLSAKSFLAWRSDKTKQLELLTNNYGRAKLIIELVALGELVVFGISDPGLLVGNLLLGTAAMLAIGSLLSKLVNSNTKK